MLLTNVVNYDNIYAYATRYPADLMDSSGAKSVQKISHDGSKSR